MNVDEVLKNGRRAEEEEEDDDEDDDGNDGGGDEGRCNRSRFASCKQARG